MIELDLYEIMNKKDWLGFLLALIIFSTIQLVLGTFDLINTIIASVVVISIMHIINQFRK